MTKIHIKSIEQEVTKIHYKDDPWIKHLLLKNQ